MTHDEKLPETGARPETTVLPQTSGQARWQRTALDPHPRSVTQVRHETRTVLRDWGADELEWAVSQLLTEVTSNVVLHAGTPFDIVIRYDSDVDGGRLRCEVRDANPRPPKPRDYSLQATTGRGLRLLETLASDWGVERHPGDGKTVWFEVTANHGDSAMFDLENLLDAFSPESSAPSSEAGQEGGRPPDQTPPADVSDPRRWSMVVGTTDHAGRRGAEAARRENSAA